jgi:hypothetical protein
MLHSPRRASCFGLVFLNASPGPSQGEKQAQQVSALRPWGFNTLQSKVILWTMTGRQIGAVAAIFLAGIGCMKADRLVAVQIDVVQADALPLEMDGGGDVAGADIVGADSRVGSGPFSAATPITGLFSPTATIDIHGPSLTKDELELYFSCEELGATSFHIWASTRLTPDAKWNPAKQVDELFGSNFDVDPDLSPDGLTIYFSSNRLGAGYRLYVTQRIARDKPWNYPPNEIKELTSSTQDRKGPSVDPSGHFMVFCSAPQGTENFNLYSASRNDPNEAWGNVQELSGINSVMADADPALFLDSTSLIWSSRAPSNGKSWDLVEVRRPDLSTPFSATPTTLDSLNTPYAERYPWVSQDGTHIVFTREAVGGPGVLYEAWR